MGFAPNLHMHTEQLQSRPVATLTPDVQQGGSVGRQARASQLCSAAQTLVTALNIDGEAASQGAQSAAAFMAVFESADVKKGRVMSRNEIKRGLFTMLLIRQLVTLRPPHAPSNTETRIFHISPAFSLSLSFYLSLPHSAQVARLEHLFSPRTDSFTRSHV